MAPKDPEIEILKKELQETIERIQRDSKGQFDVTLSYKCQDLQEAPKIRATCKRLLRGHIGKVNAIHFSEDNRHLVSGSLDGKLIIWDIFTGNKTQIIPLLSSWVMSVAFAPSGNYVASGGMDNQCTIHDVNNRDDSGAAKVAREIVGYDGFLSCCRFLDDRNLLTGSGDMKVLHWDTNTGKKLHQYFGHSGDVATLSIAPDCGSFATGSVDRTIKLWDLRDSKECMQTFWGHTSDVNSVCFHPSGYGFCTGSEDKTARLWDIRSDQQVAEYSPPTANSGFTSCVLSKSGRYVLCGSDDNQIHVWDTLKTTHCGTLRGHENRITSLSITEDGMAIASASWDSNVRVWGM